jgi:hypothetical protein
MEGDELVRTCSTRAGGGKCIQTFGLKIVKEKFTLET